MRFPALHNVTLKAGNVVAVCEKRPKPHTGWTEAPCPAVLRAQSPLGASAWTCGPIRVLSELAVAQSAVEPSTNVPQWHISVTDRGRRPKPLHVRKALRAFGMVGAEEDNHYPGQARTFWLAVDPAHRADCECKETEETVVDADGYRWQNPKEATECRGCEYESIFGKPCPLHGQSEGRSP